MKGYGMKTTNKKTETKDELICPITNAGMIDAGELSVYNRIINNPRLTRVSGSSGWKNEKRMKGKK